jgi:nitrous oxidase accessory protein NosD
VDWLTETFAQIDARVTAEVTALVTARDQALAEVTALNAKVVELEALIAELTKPTEPPLPVDTREVITVTAPKQVISGKSHIRITGGGAPIVDLTVVGCNDVVIENQTIKSTTKAVGGLTLDNSTNVEIVGCVVTSDVDFSVGVYGLHVKNGSDGVLVQFTTFTKVHRSIVSDHSSHLTYIDNEVVEVRGEGFNFAGCTDVEIARNILHDFNPAVGDHPDCFQFWTNGVRRASERVHIHDNEFWIGDGKTTGAQFILMGVTRKFYNPIAKTWSDTPLEAGSVNLQYRNIVIENNKSLSSFGIGITIAYCENLTVKRNTCVIPPEIRALGVTADGMRHDKNQINLMQISGAIDVQKNISNSFSLNTAAVFNGTAPGGNIVIGTVTEAEYLKTFEDLVDYVSKIDAGAVL